MSRQVRRGAQRSGTVPEAEPPRWFGVSAAVAVNGARIAISTGPAVQVATPEVFVTAVHPVDAAPPVSLVVTGTPATGRPLTADRTVVV